MTLVFLLLALWDNPKDPEWMAPMAALVASTAKVNLDDATQQLAAAKKARINAKAFGVNKKGETIYRDKEGKLRAIMMAQQEIEECTAILAGTGTPTLPARPLREGDFGTLVGFVTVQQVVSPTAAIVDVIRENYGVGKLPAWLDTDTTGWVDDKSYRLSLPLRIVGTKKYDTAIGSSRTVLHIATMTDAEMSRLSELVKQMGKALTEDGQKPLPKSKKSTEPKR